ncbi:E3 ubiquitin ligase complex SCF subunit [Balamuthia mandrillaris]
MASSTSVGTGEVTLESADGQEFRVDREAIALSVTIRHMLGDLSKSMDALDAPIPLPNVSAPVLEKVIDYCNYHYLHPVADRAEDDYSIDIADEWDAEFIEVEIGLLFDIILAANFLDIKPLLDLGCKVVAKMIIGKTPAQIEATFRMPS